MKKMIDKSRRKFITDLTLGAVGAVGATNLLVNCAGTEAVSRAKDGRPAQLKDQAPDGATLKAGLIGCGGRGTGAAVNFVDAGPNLEIVALGDVFQDQLDKCRESLKAARNIDIPDENCFVGFDAYEKVMDAGVDMVLLAAPGHFRPDHVKAAVDAGKHIFQEKPVAVDPVGARLMMESTERAKLKNLCMVSGTIRRYQKDYMETLRRVHEGQIGSIVSANIVRNGGPLWWVERQPEWSDMEYMLRNWGNFTWLSGDTIVEIFVHEIDVMNSYIKRPPERAIGYGGRQRRQSGDQYDHFSIVFEYDDGMNVTTSHRSINGCDNKKIEKIFCTEGYADASGSLYCHSGELIWEYPYPDEGDSDQTWRVNNPSVQEHVELVTAIRTGNYLNDSEAQIMSTRMAIMGRMAAYTGRDVTWEEVLNSDLRLGPKSYAFGPVHGISETPPKAGTYRPATERYTT